MFRKGSLKNVKTNTKRYSYSRGKKADTEAFVEKLKKQEIAAIERLQSFRERLRNKKYEKGD